MKPFLSLLCIGLFLFMAMASEFLDESSNTFIIVDECEAKPPFSGTLTISVHCIDFALRPIEDASCKIVLTHQVINELECISTIETLETYTKPLDENGRFTFTTEAFTHKNIGDLWRVEVLVLPYDEEDDYPGFQQVKVAAYNVTSLDFFNQAPAPL